MGRAPPGIEAPVERNPAEKQPSGDSDHGHPTSNTGGLLYREPQGAGVCTPGPVVNGSKANTGSNDLIFSSHLYIILESQIIIIHFYTQNSV